MQFNINSPKSERISYCICMLFLTFSVIKEAGKEGDEDRTKFETLLYSVTLVSFFTNLGFVFYRLLILS